MWGTLRDDSTSCRCGLRRFLALVKQDRIAFAGELDRDFVHAGRALELRAGHAHVVVPFTRNTGGRFTRLRGRGSDLVQFADDAFRHGHQLLHCRRRQLCPGLLQVKLERLDDEVFFFF
jgi:hypothetical protein